MRTDKRRYFMTSNDDPSKSRHDNVARRHKRQVRKAWLQVAGISVERLTNQSVCEVVKAYAEGIGLKATDFGPPIPFGPAS
jgi:hypothetical protein